jgi:2-oxoglutarate ferredoxin oxidoreductase subunit alpha
MNSTDIQIIICGSAGDGTIAAGDILKRAMARAGYKIISFDIYPAEIRGFGKCVARVRITTEQVYSLKPQCEILVSLDDSQAIEHVAEVRDFGAVVYEGSPISRVPEGRHITAHIKPGQLPYALAQRQISEQTTGVGRSRNIVSLGFVAGLWNLPAVHFHEIIMVKFARKGAAVAESNLLAFDAGFKAGAEAFKLDDVALKPPTHAAEGAEVKMMTGNGAVVRACLDVGIDAFFGYPITPATPIMERLFIEMPKVGAFALQTEDEISAIGAALGAGYAGARTATATSGPGLALMTEMLGLGVMAEVPAVVFVCQRGGPATGLPTKTEQSDLNLAVHGGAGDAQRIVLAPTDVEGCYRCAGKAFELAEQFQAPVIVLLDLYLCNRYETVVPPKDNPFEPNTTAVASTLSKNKPYRRYAATEAFVSPRTLPGHEGGMHTITGLEHDEFGHPNDQPAVHSAMSAKRHKKLAAALERRDFNLFKRFGDEGSVDVGILGWGSTFGECLEAMLAAQAEGIRCAAMKVVMLSPLPVDPIADFLADCKEVLVPELNYEGQFASLVTAAVGRPVTRLNRVTGAPMEVEEILNHVRSLAKDRTAA